MVIRRKPPVRIGLRAVEIPVRPVARAVGFGCTTAEISRLNPDKLHAASGYHHITVVEAGRAAYLAGQCPLGRSGALVGPGGLDAQIDQVASDALVALAAVGAEPSRVVRSVIYVVSDDVTDLGAARRRLTGSVIGSAFTTASTLLGVARLGFPGQLIEVDLTAALPG
ncbi:Rid family hydrolase [Streptomyces sp. NPDC005969]|uniref:RidA family protein n=1 Tax=Streptomyces sp. NPDC005969 TaxID=3156722 RepID=UPI00340BE171